VSDEAYTPFSGRRSEPEKPILIDRVWRVRNPRTGRVLSCGLYSHPIGVEVRCGYQDEANLLRSHVIRSQLGAGRALAAQWLEAAKDKGFEEIPL
jgi:hypothetical protein